jgi:hypothetical protein
VSFDLAIAAEPQGLRLRAPRRHEVLEDPVRFDEIARAKVKIEVGPPVADRNPPGQIEARLREAQLVVFEPDRPVADGKRSAPFRGDAEPPANLRDRGQRRDVEQASPVGPVDSRRPPVELDCSRAAPARPVPGRPRSAKKLSSEIPWPSTASVIGAWL